MLNIKKSLTNAKDKTVAALRSRNTFDFATIAIMVVALLALLALIVYYVVPIRTIDVKVPVATDQSTYAPGEPISGIFFGEVFYEGRVKVLREVFCTNYKATIEPPASNADGDFFATISQPRKLEGQTVPIGNLPKEIPVDVNCVLRFTNLYEIQTPFGIRRIEYSYYTQNFSIISQERRDVLDCEAAGGTDCLNTTKTDEKEKTPVAQSPSVNYYGGPDASEPSSNQNTTNNTTNNSTTNNTTNNNPPAEPVEPPRQCTVNALGLHLFCD